MAQPFRTSNGQHMPRSGEGKGCVGTQAVCVSIAQTRMDMLMDLVAYLSDLCALVDGGAVHELPMR
jgi:hypothetical protein